MGNWKKVFLRNFGKLVVQYFLILGLKLRKGELFKNFSLIWNFKLILMITGSLQVGGLKGFQLIIASGFKTGKGCKKVWEFGS